MLASGSSGNSTFIEAGRTRLLVDCGLSRREIGRRLAAIGEDLARIDAILVSHEHSDHVSGLPVITRRADAERRKSGLSQLPVYMTRLASPAISWEKHQPAIETFQAGSRISIGDIEVDTFTIPHDAADPIGFCFRAEGLKIGLATDLGYIPESIKFHLRACHLLILESNHDLEMLKVGPYPWSVKQRVMSRIGHLSNDSVSDFIGSELDGATATLVLGHLSEHNNHPAIARLAASQALARRGLETKLVVAGRAAPTEVFQF
ncbi:MAG: MBL fold metallo-hydrolase [Acidobacteriota bacterium]